MTQEIPADLWTAASHAQTGRALQRAIQNALKLRQELDRNDPIDTAFLTGLGFLLRLSEQHLAYDRIRGFKRDVPGYVQQVRGELTELRERISMPVKEQEVTKKLVELGVSEDATLDRLVLPGADFKGCIHLRSRGLDARYSQVRRVSVPAREHDQALALLAMVGRNGSDWLAEGRALIDGTA